MSERQLLPALNMEFAGLSDAASIAREVEILKEDLSQKTAQTELERNLAKQIHIARYEVVSNNPVLQVVLNSDDISDEEKAERYFSPQDMVNGAFNTKTPTLTLPDDFSKTARELRAKLHPDKGGDSEIAKEVGGILDDLPQDGLFAFSKAFLLIKETDPSSGSTEIEELRKERYLLTLATSGLNTTFSSEGEAKEKAKIEIEGAEWRVRSIAALKCFNQIIGNSDILNGFLNEILESRHHYLMNYMNEYLPQVLSLNERIQKGNPIDMDPSALELVDSVFERIWSAIGTGTFDDIVTYSPPYQNWLEVILPAMQILDPGKKPGEEYSEFKPPFSRIPPPSPIIHGKTKDSLYGTKNINKDSLLFTHNNRFY